jgi:regulator of sirC expression with transglutaminase-like and TPR domain
MDLADALDQLAHDPDADLDPAAVALHLARDEYPELDVEASLSELAGMAHEARRFVRGDLPACVHGLCRYLFHEMGFRGNRRDYYDPRNSYLNQVLDRRTGIPITLSLVALAVGRGAGLDVVGVGLPGHFVAKAVRDREEQVFDPFHGGRALSSHECEILVRQVTGAPFTVTAAQLQPVTVGALITRLLSNLKAIYLRQGDFVRSVRVLERLCRIVPGDVAQRRDLGLSLYHAGRPGEAIDHLETFLAAGPGGDVAPVRAVLERARGEIAKWN